VSFGMLTLSILWGLFGATRHGVPPGSSRAAPVPITSGAAP
jgi:hypothetical protein